MVVAVNPEPVSVKAVQAVNGAEPQKSFPVLQAAVHTIVRESVFNMVVFEIIFLSKKSGMPGKKANQKIDYFFLQGAVVSKHKLV